MSEEKAKYWLNGVLDKIEEKYPEGEIIVSSGISPSASYHIGHFRELLSSDMVSEGLRQRGRKTKHLHVIDNFDPLRKRYDFLPKEYEQYVGWPVCLVPDPQGCHDNYAEHFYKEFEQSHGPLNVDIEVVHSYNDLYKNGKMASQIEKAIEKTEVIKEIFKRISNRDLPDDWAPVQILSDNNNFDEWHFKDIDTKEKRIKYVDKDGGEGWVPYDDGRVKLNWRLDWPARWQLLNVMVEPHGFQEHGASGGSFQTGKEFAREVFGFEGPVAGMQYGHVHLAGDNQKMSSSLGNLITPKQAFEIMPPEMIKYFYLRYPGKKRIDFDPGIGLYRMMDEYSQVDRAVRAGEDHQFASAYKLANVGIKSHGMASIPFNHLVSIYQASLGDEEKVFETLRRSGYEKEATEQEAEIKQELVYVRNWLDKWAPEEVKFSLSESLPTDFTDQEKKLLLGLAKIVEGDGEGKDGQWYHEQIHSEREKVDLGAGDAFKVVYRALLGKDSGPKAGWFLSILDRDFLIKRFRLEA